MSDLSLKRANATNDPNKTSNLFGGATNKQPSLFAANSVGAGQPSSLFGGAKPATAGNGGQTNSLFGGTNNTNANAG